MKRTGAVGLLILGGLGAASSDAWAETYEIGPSDELQSAVSALAAGDELVLQGGTYLLGYRFSIGVSGNEQAPIVIRSKDGETATIDHDESQNTINVENAQWVELRNLEVVHGSHGIRIDHSTHITVEGCHIHDTGDVALSANTEGSSFDGLRLLRNHIHHTSGTGEGMYLGCNSNGCQLLNSLIEGNYIHHTNGATVSQGDGIEIKEGSHDNVVRDNVIHDTGYPCILTYSAVGNGGPNVIERNALWACGDHGIQAAEDVVIRNNIILGAAADGIRNQIHQAGVPRNIVIVHNTVLHPGGTAVRSDSIAGSVVIANNALYSNGGNAIQASGDLGQLVTVGNVGMGSLQGPTGGFDATGSLATDFVAASFSGAVPNDVFPATGGRLVGTGDAAHVVDDDFNGTARGGAADVGAYRYDAAGNPGWTLAAEPKDIEPGTGGSGTGGSGTGAGGTGAAGGSPEGGSSSAGGSGTGAAGGSAVTPGDGSDEGGCGCRAAAGSSSSQPAAALLAVGLGLVSVRRRRR